MTNEENERYWIEISSGVVLLHDDVLAKVTPFTGPDRLLAATAEFNRLTVEPEMFGPLFHLKPFAPTGIVNEPGIIIAEPGETQAASNEEQNEERYVLEIRTGEIWLIDSEMGTHQTFTGPGRLMAATAERCRLNADSDWTGETQEWEMPEPITPASFLAETLPAVARRQRLESQLAEVTEIEDRYLALVAEDALRFKKATELRCRIADALARPLSATLPDENAPEVVVDTLIAEGLESAAEALAEQKEDAPTFPRLTETFKRECYPLPELRPYQAEELKAVFFKPGPY